MRKPDPKQIESRIRAAAATGATKRHLLRSQWTLGGPGGTVQSRGSIPAAFGTTCFGDLDLSSDELGTLRTVIVTAERQLSRLMTSDIMPSFAGLDAQTIMVRKEFFKARYRDRRRGGQWHEEIAAAWLDGDLNGTGILRGGVIAGKGSTNRVTVRHQPAYHTLIDPVNTRNPWRARYIVFLDAVPLEEAEEQYNQNLRRFSKVWTRKGDKGEASRVVPIAEYFDIGIGKTDPSRVIIAGESHILDIDENPVEDEIPAAFMLGFTPPGAAEPLGRAVLQRTAAELRHECNRILKKQAEKGGAQRYINMAMLSPEFKAMLESGEILDPDYLEIDTATGERIQSENIGGIIPPLPINPALTYLIDMAKTEERDQSLQDDLTGGRTPRRKESATTMALIQQAGQQNLGLATHKTLKYAEGVVAMVLKIARDFDTEPVMLNIYGENIEFNKRTEPQSMMKVWLEEIAQVTIGRQQLTAEDSNVARALDVQRLEALAPYVGKTINAEAFTRELLKTLDFQNADELMQSVAPANVQADGGEAPPGTNPGEAPGQSALPGGIPPELAQAIQRG